MKRLDDRVTPHSQSADLSPRARLFGIVAAISTISAVGIGLSLGYPLLSLVLDARGISSFWIGVNTAVAGFAAMAVTPLATPMARRFGVAPAALIAVLVAAAAFLSFYFATAFWVWFPLRVALSGAVTLAFIFSEFWIVALAPEKHRGLVVGIYASVLSVGFAVGPLLIQWVGIEGIRPFALGALVLAAAGLPTVLAWRISPVIGGRATPSLTRFLVAAPLATLAGFVFGSVESAALSLLPVFGVNAGYGVAAAALLVSAMAAGSIALQIPIGLLADRTDRRRVLALCALIGLGGGLAMPLASANPLLLFCILFLWGGVVAGLYTVGLTHLGARFSGSDLASANAAFIMMYSLGAVVGPASAGALMRLTPLWGLPMAIVIFMAFYVAVAVRRIVRVERHSSPAS